MDHCEEPSRPIRRRRRRFLGRVGQAGAPVPGPPDARDRSYVFDGERSLRRAVLYDAVMTIIKNAHAVRPRGRRLFAEARAWVAEDDPCWPFSFVNICDALDLSVTRVRSSIEQLRSAARREAPSAPEPEIVTWPIAKRVLTG
jgi:hypothetical protein